MVTGLRIRGAYPAAFRGPDLPHGVGGGGRPPAAPPPVGFGDDHPHHCPVRSGLFAADVAARTPTESHWLRWGRALAAVDGSDVPSSTPQELATMSEDRRAQIFADELSTYDLPCPGAQQERRWRLPVLGWGFGRMVLRCGNPGVAPELKRRYFSEVPRKP